MHLQTSSLDDWRAAQSHHFAATSPKQFEHALQAALDASQPRAYTVRPAPGGVIAERRWNEYAVLAWSQGLERWQIAYDASDDGVDARADLTAMPTNVWPPDFSVVDRPDNPATYDLLWARVSYMLGQRSDWETCDAFGASLRHRSMDALQSWGLCGAGADDNPQPKR